MNALKEGWFSEINDLWPGQALSLKVKNPLFHEKSKFQDVLVFESENNGRVLVLDGVIQLTEKDEFSYQEMLTHLPLFAHENPERVLVIGGGDGGVLREVARHDCVKEIVICELDQMVIDVAKQFLPFTACGFDDKRVTVHVGDGAAYMAAHEGHFDVIVVDSSDPIGPADVLFEKPFYMAMKRALRPNGVVATQCESMWLHTDIIDRVMSFCRDGGFASVEYAWCSIPTYPSGAIGFALVSLNDRSCSEPMREPDDATAAALRYYSPEMHRAAFALPAFLKRVVQKK